MITSQLPVDEVDNQVGEKMSDCWKVMDWDDEGAGMRPRDTLCLRLVLEREMA